MANEKRLIDANALWDEVEKSQHNNPHVDGRVKLNHRQEHDHFLKMIYDAQTVEAVEVVHGRWHKPTPCSQEFCINCGLTPKTNFGWLPPYCPNCGAKMDGDGNV